MTTNTTFGSSNFIRSYPILHLRSVLPYHFLIFLNSACSRAIQDREVDYKNFYRLLTPDTHVNKFNPGIVQNLFAVTIKTFNKWRFSVFFCLSFSHSLLFSNKNSGFFRWNKCCLPFS